MTPGASALLGLGLFVAAADGTALRGRPLSEVRVEAAPDEEPSELRRLSQLEAGQVYDPAAVRRAIKALHRLGRFEDVKAFVREDEAGEGLILTLELPPLSRLTEVQLIEVGAAGSGLVRRGLGVREGDPIRPEELSLLRRRLELALERSGWRQPAVGLALEPVDAEGGQRLLVRVDPGPLVRVRDLTFTGNPRAAPWELEDRFDFGAGDVLDLDRLERAVEELAEGYRERGYYDAEVGVEKVIPVVIAEAPMADVRVRVVAGPRVELRIQGNERFPQRWLRAEAEVLKERGTDRATLQEVQDRMLDALLIRGYAEAKVRFRVSEDPSGNVRRIVYRVREGPVARLGAIRFRGRSSIPRERLVERYRQTAERTLSRVLGQPGVDPRVVEQLVGGRASTERRVRAVDSTPPDPAAVFVDRAARAASDGIAELYRSEGFQLVEVRAPETEVREDGLMDLIYEIREGVQWVASEVRFEGNDGFGATELQPVVSKKPGVAPGAPIVFENLEEARRRVEKFYRDDGYLFVEVYDGYTARLRRDEQEPLEARARCLEAEESGRKACRLPVVFRIVEGPVVTTDRILVRTERHTRESVIRSELEVEPDRVLREKDIELSRERLLRLGVFERVSVEPADPDRIESRKDVLVDVSERNRYALELGAGLSTEDGIRLFGAVSDNNFMGRAIRLQLDSRINYWPGAFSIIYNEAIRDEVEDFFVLGRSFFERLEFQVAAGLSVPRIFGLPRGFAGGVDLVVLRDLDPAFLETSQELGLSFAYRGFRPRLFGRPRPLALELRAGLERTDLECNDDLTGDETQRALLCGGEGAFVPGVVLLERSTVYLTGGPVVSIDLRDDPLDPNGGAYLEVKTVLAKGLDSPEQSPDFARVEGRANFYVPISPRVTWASAFLARRVEPLNADGVPVNQRIFAGGRTTIRGYQENTLLPQDVQVDPETGQAIGEISAGGRLFMGLKNELRVRLGGTVSLVAFHDVGDLFESGDFSLSTTQQVDDGEVTRRLAQGAGLGLRLATPVGPLALDLAHPIDARDQANNLQLHFAVGAF